MWTKIQPKSINWNMLIIEPLYRQAWLQSFFNPFNSRLNITVNGKEFMFRHQDLQMFWSQIKQIWVIFTHSKL